MLFSLKQHTNLTHSLNTPTHLMNRRRHKKETIRRKRVIKKKVNWDEILCHDRILYYKLSNLMSAPKYYKSLSVFKWFKTYSRQVKCVSVYIKCKEILCNSFQRTQKLNCTWTWCWLAMDWDKYKMYIFHKYILWNYDINI